MASPRTIRSSTWTVARRRMRWTSSNRSRESARSSTSRKSCTLQICCAAAPNWPLSVSSSSASVAPQLGHEPASCGYGIRHRAQWRRKPVVFADALRGGLDATEDELLGSDAEAIAVLQLDRAPSPGRR